ncbi:hypothetical protein BDZ45DRAFT_92212 [Acephala macrosclerotiorum]|nr:hypothetical protein BDZ45DRAFT_92212 [Acephala macrosclerotiorum]
MLRLRLVPDKENSNRSQHLPGTKDLTIYEHDTEFMRYFFYRTRLSCRSLKASYIDIWDRDSNRKGQTSLLKISGRDRFHEDARSYLSHRSPKARITSCKSRRQVDIYSKDASLWRLMLKMADWSSSSYGEEISETNRVLPKIDGRRFSATNQPLLG